MYYAQCTFYVPNKASRAKIYDTKTAMAFRTRKERDEFLASRYHFDATAKSISRREAEKLAHDYTGNGDYAVRLYNSYPDFIVIKISRHSVHKLGDII